jgi:hypothetical protein
MFLLKKYQTRPTLPMSANAGQRPRPLYVRFILAMLVIVGIGLTFVVLANSTLGLAFGLLVLSIGAGGVSAGLMANLETGYKRARVTAAESKHGMPQPPITESSDHRNASRTGPTRG